MLDDLRQGHRAALPEGVRLVAASLADADALDAVLADGGWHAVFHFAALSLVGESMREPLRYLLENGALGIRLIDACVRHGVRALRAVLHRQPVRRARRVPIDEDAPSRPPRPTARAS